MKLYIIIIFDSGGQFSAEGGFIFASTAGVQLGYPSDDMGLWNWKHWGKEALSGFNDRWSRLRC